MSVSISAPAASAFDVAAVREAVPALHQTVHGRPLVYLDNGATTQKPQAVIDRIVRYYTRENANVHRGVHALSQTATDAMEAARARIAAYVGADAREIVFTRGTTEAVNLVADAWGRAHVGAGDMVVTTMDAHHANFVPWQQLCQRTGARFVVVPVFENGVLDRGAYRDALALGPALVALGHVSNALGTVHPVADLVAEAKAAGAVTLVDGAQALVHVPVDVRAIGTDFYVASGHKAYGPMGIGFLYGRFDLLDALAPYQFGGDMVDAVSVDKTTFAAVPTRFEAGTPHVEGILGFATALDWFDGLGREAVFAHEHDVLAYATERLAALGGIRLVGTAPGKVSVLSFLVEGAHPYDVGALLDQQGVAVRTGHHCAHPLMQHLGVPGTVRATFAAYNTREDADAFVAAVAKAQQMLV